MKNPSVIQLYLPGSVYYLHPCIDNYEKYRNPLWILESEDNTEIKEINNNNSSKFVL